MKTKHTIMGTALRLASFTVAFSGLTHAQQLDGSAGVDLGSTGSITNVPYINFPSANNFGWDQPGLQGYVVPAGQLTGISTTGALIPYADLLPLKANSLRIPTNPASTGIVPGDAVTIDSNGISTTTLRLPLTGVYPEGSALIGDTVFITVTEGQLFLNGYDVITPALDAIAPTRAPVANSSQMVSIPGGTLTTFRGQSANVVIAPFKMARTELTFGEWFRTLRWAVANGYSLEPTTQFGYTTPVSLSVDMSVSPISIKFSSGSLFEVEEPGGHSQGGMDHPVVGVEGWDAMAWCNAKSVQSGLQPVYYIDANSNNIFDTGEEFKDAANWRDFYFQIKVDKSRNGFRLPGPEEWEWAARGGNMSANIFPWGTTVFDSSRANVNSQGGQFMTCPVGSFPAGVNPYGLHDMAGNVSETVLEQDFYAQKAGGSDGMTDVNALRVDFNPPQNDENGRFGTAGIRLVRSN
jgi:formylglycine-generating enzyme